MKKAILLAACAYVAVLYNLPQLERAIHGQRAAVVLQDDEVTYGARVERVIQGRFSVGNQWLFEHRDLPNPIPTLPDFLLGFPAWIWSHLSGSAPTAASVAVIARSVAPVLDLLALAWLLQLLGLSLGSATGVALFVLVEPGLISFKPLGFLLFHQSSLPLDRFWNPLLPLAGFFATAALAALAFFATPGKQQRFLALLAGYALGLQFYVSVYYWTHLIAALLVFTLLSRLRGRFQVLALGALGAAIVAVPYVLQSLQLRQVPTLATFAWRNGLLLHESARYLLPHKTLWLFVFLSLPGFALAWRDEKRRFLAALVLGGLLCYFSSLVTGITFQNFHWHYTLAPCLAIAVYLSFVTCVPVAWRRPPMARAALAALAVVLLVLDPVLAAHRWEKSAEASGKAAALNSEPGYDSAWRWLRDQASPDSVVLASLGVMQQTPLRSGLRVWTSEHLISDLTPDEEILARNQVLWAMEGLSGPSLEREIAPEANPPVATWIFGMTGEQLAGFRGRGYPPVVRDESVRLAAEVSARQERLPVAELLSPLRRLRLDWIIRGPREQDFGDRPERYLKLEPAVVLDGGRIRIDRVLGLK